MFVDVSVDHRLSFCAEALSAGTEQKQKSVWLLLSLHYSYYLKPQKCLNCLSTTYSCMMTFCITSRAYTVSL